MRMVPGPCIGSVTVAADGGARSGCSLPAQQGAPHNRHIDGGSPSYRDIPELPRHPRVPEVHQEKSCKAFGSWPESLGVRCRVTLCTATTGMGPNGHPVPPKGS